MSEIDDRVQRLADRCMVGKLLAVIGRNGLGILLVRGGVTPNSCSTLDVSVS